MSDNRYKQLIFTAHALDRMKSRSISQDAVWRVVSHPDSTTPEDKPQTTRFVRTLNHRRYHVVGTYLKDERKTLIISVWVRGEEDRPSLAWSLITAPFKLVWWIIRKLTSILKTIFLDH